MRDAKQIAAALSPDESAAMRGFFFSNAVGKRLLEMGLFASPDGWPMTKLGGQVQRALFAAALTEQPRTSESGHD